ncbi:MAG: peptidoglycan bridge formation glycyltransferase FemA/FemB family protein [Chloroflexi bacterium]|nr:peptidoglycan bridge formation glycyltransferase FemA/FemB family protein [Chloroflexota bacterium]
MSVRILHNPSDQQQGAWDAFLAAHPGGHVLQTSRWAALKARFGWRPCLVQLVQGGAIQAGAALLFRRLPLGQTLAYVPKGPVVCWDQADQAQELLAALRQAAQAGRAWSLTLEPELPQGHPAVDTLTRAGFQPAPRAIQPRSTIWVDLQGSPQEALERMKPKTRYNLRLASRKGVVVRPAQEADLPAFYRLMQTTAARDGFPVHASAYYEEAYRLFVPSGWAQVLLAYGEEGLLGGLMVFAFGPTAWYMYGASADVGRQRMPNHLLQWEAMQWARSRGCRTYDLWGIPDEVGQQPSAYQATVTERGDGLWGVYRFKQGFGGQVVRTVGAWQQVYSRPGHWLAEEAWPGVRRLWRALRQPGQPSAADRG